MSLPLRNGTDTILHRVGAAWVPEGKHRGQRTVWVTHLSLFSTLSSKAAKALCLTWDPRRFLRCLALKGLKHVDKELALWIADKISHNCAAAIIASLPYDRILVPLELFTNEACIGKAVDGPPGGSPGPPNPPPHPAQPPTSSGPYPHHVFGTCGDGACGLTERVGPGWSNQPKTGRVYVDTQEVDVVCQRVGEPVGPSPATGHSSAIWDQLTTGGWVSDLYVDTPNIGTFSPPIPAC